MLGGWCRCDIPVASDSPVRSPRARPCWRIALCSALPWRAAPAHRARVNSLAVMAVVAVLGEGGQGNEKGGANRRRFMVSPQIEWAGLALIYCFAPDCGSKL